MQQFKRIVFSDADGTIYEFPDHKLSLNTQKSVLDAKKEGVEFVVVTGNPLFEKMTKLAHNLESNYIITSNGAEIYDLVNKKHLFSCAIDDNELHKIVEIVKQNNAGLMWNNFEHFGLINLDKSTQDFYCYFNDFNDYKIDEKYLNSVLKVEITSPIDNLQTIYDSIAKLNLNINIIKMSNYIEITHKNASKEHAVEWMCKNIFNVELSNVMAIGDNFNDLKMLKSIGFGYIMDNAPAELKKEVNLYACSVEQNGLGEAINDYIYRTRLLKEKADIAKKIYDREQKLKAKYNY
ncbi:Cof-type HAD-IIB family hydrolase [Mycoplasmopsis mucosicanis]|uniref:Cof-type HAD-IIB family hydrolase n=1 Tax=Mycoplasmopsis mucosicanis TaxID=458208 RepID=A0A507SKX1_9BACT|nr:Cof-type HAD-IIB family hydrolase [Mycoplasmopsis mucosicanis]TQC51596.1 Cof-type HAD-IIB family hydrolase [Mycoplasmopsis mucosicanis]